MSKNFRKSDYARNKMNKTAIVYEREVVTYEKVTITQPEYTQDRFMNLKKDSDEDLRIIDRRNTVESKHIKCSIDEVKNSAELITKSCEDEYVEKENINDKIEKFYQAISVCVLNLLTRLKFSAEWKKEFTMKKNIRRL